MSIVYKTTIFFGFLGLILNNFACDKGLKEHPMPVSLKRKMQMKNDPDIMAKKITGTISLDFSAKNKIKLLSDGTLFIFARPKGTTDGPPLAVKRIRYAGLPFEYSIGQVDAMLPSADFSGEVQITARLDGDGIAGASLGDLEGKVIAQVGSENINISLSEYVPKELKPLEDSGTVSGTLNISKLLKDRVPKNAYLFIYVRRSEAPRGTPPLAVKRLQGITFPYKFRIGENDRMIPGTKITGKLLLTARLDGDGDARASSGDIEGQINAFSGENGIVFSLNRVISQSSNYPKEIPKSIKGIASVSPELEEELSDGVERLFIILRQKDAFEGLPLAVQLHKQVLFPFSFEIGQKDAMIPGTVVEGEVEIIVRVDRDENAKSSPGDLEGNSSATVGEKGIVITLNKRV